MDFLYTIQAPITYIIDNTKFNDEKTMKALLQLTKSYHCVLIWRLHVVVSVQTNLGYPEASKVMRVVALLPSGTGVRRIRGGRMVIQGGWPLTVMNSSL